MRDQDFERLAHGSFLAAADKLGIPVIVTSALPIYPSPGADARRIVRHGLADVLEWLGEEVGPKPGAPTEVMVVNGATHVSAAFVNVLRGDS